ncbi:MAG: aspartate aminotransferase family protein [Hyphomicrobiaceae bacterium]|nr:aspartate aminotransferase family protein [Hyphomicrobiaceae bacterium]
MNFDKSAAYNAGAATLIPGSVNSNVRLAGYPLPLCFERGEGPYLFDIDGNRYVDYALGMGPTILGHAPKEICAAVAASLASGQLFAGQHPAELELARRMNKLVPSAESVRFGLTGSEAVQAAIRLARAHTGRQKFIKFEGQYHGWYDNVLLNHAPRVLAEGDVGEIPREIHFETKGQARSVGQDVVVLPWNRLDLVERVLDKVGDEIAAIITEPAMCNTGAIAPAAGFLEGLRAASTRHGVILIFDEVITGFRLAIGGGQQRFGVTPDLSTFAKAMAAGFPVSALAGRRELMDLFAKGVNHSGTYNSNLPGIAAAIATLDLLGANNARLLEDADAAGTELMRGIAVMGQERGMNLRVQGFGTCFNVFFAREQHVVSDYQSYRRTDLEMQQRFLRELLNRGIRPTSRGTWFVSTAHTKAAIDETLEKVGIALGAL